jgi:hypothetical protein
VTRLLLLLLVVAGLSACSASSGDGKDSGKPAIEVAVRADGDVLVVSGTTTVHDPTQVRLLVSRNVKFAKDDMPRSTTVAEGKATTSGGHFTARLPVDESELVFDAGGDRYGKIETIADSVTACAQVQSSGMSKPPLEAIATIDFPSTALPDLKTALGKVPPREHRLGQAYCAIKAP